MPCNFNFNIDLYYDGCIKCLTRCNVKSEYDGEDV